MPERRGQMCVSLWGTKKGNPVGVPFFCLSMIVSLWRRRSLAGLSRLKAAAIEEFTGQGIQRRIGKEKLCGPDG